MTTTPFTTTLNSFAEYLEYEFQAELALESSHLNLPERIHEPSDSALVLEARTGSGFGPPPSKYINHHAYFNSEILNNKL